MAGGGRGGNLLFIGLGSDCIVAGEWHGRCNISLS
jgi:hypothetical protein